MFSHILKYRIKQLFKDKVHIFWNMIFPFCLANIFFFAFNMVKDVESTKILKTYSISVEDTNLKNILKDIKYNDKNIFNLIEQEPENIKKDLETEEIIAYIKGNDDYKIIFDKKNLDTEVVKAVLNTVIHRKEFVSDILKNTDERDINNILTKIEKSEVKIEKLDFGDKGKSKLDFYILTVLTMSMLSTSTMGVHEIEDTEFVRRKTLGTVSKIKLLFSSMFASYIVGLMSPIILILYMNFILKIDFNQNLEIMMLISIIGTACGFFLGTVVGVLIKGKEEKKQGLMVMIYLISSFIGGMMNPEVAFYLSSKIPGLKYLNPATLITDSIYSLYFYNGYSRVYRNLTYLSFVTLFFVVVTALKIRRRDYADI